jgi:hypothetical protein
MGRAGGGGGYEEGEGELGDWGLRALGLFEDLFSG